MRRMSEKENFPPPEARKQYARRLVRWGSALLIISAGATLTGRVTGLGGFLTELSVAIMVVSIGVLGLGLFGYWAVVRLKAPWFYKLQDMWGRLFHEEKGV